MSTTLDYPSRSAAVAECVPEISVVMPCLNEAETLETCIRIAQDAMSSAGIRGEVIIADNGSTDGSQQIALDCGARLINVKEKGYGHALRGGIEAARAEFVLMGDADASYDFAHIPRFLAELRKGRDLVMGNRFRGGIARDAMPPSHRYLGNPLFSLIGKVFFKAPVGDVYCGLRAFRKDSYGLMDLRCTGMEFATEMVVKASLLKMQVAEVPTTLSPDGRSRPPHLRTWRDGWRTLRFLLLYSPRWLFLYPGALLMLVGLAVSAYLIPGPRRIGSVVFDVDTLVYAAISILLGFQAISLALFAKVFGISEGLLPPDKRLDRFFSFVRLETGLVAGVLIFLAGFGLSLFATNTWRAHHFGVLDLSQIMRITLPAAVSMTLGVQIAASSFFLGLLRLKQK